MWKYGSSSPVNHDLIFTYRKIPVISRPAYKTINQ